MPAPPLFEPAGPADRWLPTRSAVGPWDPGALHGGPVAALLAGAAESCGAMASGESPMHPARMTVELLRPVPTDVLDVTATVVRPGRKVQLVVAEVSHAGTALARMTLLRIRSTDVAVPDSVGEDDPPLPDEGNALEMIRTRTHWDGFHNTGVEHRFVRGIFGEPGPATDWIRLLVPVVPGAPPTPLQRVAAAADFGNGISAIVSWETHAFINPELTVHLYRLPAGEWVCLDAVTRLSANGTGLAESVLYDERGRIGRAAQALLVEPAAH